MKLSSSLSIALLSYHRLVGVSAVYEESAVASGAASARALHRMLARKEDKKVREGNKGSDKGGNERANKDDKKGGKGGAVDANKGGKKGGKKGDSRGGSVGGAGGAKSAKAAAGHTGEMDANDSGIALTDGHEYEYGATVAGTLELVNEHVDANALAALNMDNVDQWTAGVFMRMADPQGGALAPIVAVDPEISAVSTASRRALQEDDVDVNEPDVDEPDVPDEPGTPPVLNHVGSFAITSTDAATLDPNEYGTGFDIYLLDENGAAVIGPATFYMLPTAEMKAAEDEKKKKKTNYGLNRHDHAKKKGRNPKRTTGKADKVKADGSAVGPDEKGMGYGSGSDGKMILSTSEELGAYELFTDFDAYDLGDDVTVTYDLNPSGDRRRLKLKEKGKGKGKGKDDKNGDVGDVPPIDEVTTTVPPIDEVTTTVPPVTDAPDLPYDGPAPGTPEDGFIGDGAEEEQEEIDAKDVTLYRLGVFMRMAHPQGGKLSPIVDVPFCADGVACVPEDLYAGTLAFSTNDLRWEENGLGYAVWILDGNGGGVAGPYDFSIREESLP